MIAVLVVGGGLGWIVARARSQAQVVAAIRQSGGSVRYDWQKQHFSPSEKKMVPDRPIPDWLMKTLGPDYLSNVDTASLADDPTMPPIEGALATGLGQLHQLKKLRFPSQSTMDDAGLAQLSGLTELEDLDLRCSGLTGAGIVHLAGMRKLRMLKLGSIPLRDEHLAPLSGLTKLWELSLTGDQLSDLGISHLAPLTDLKQLLIYDGNPRIVKGGQPKTKSNPEGLAEVAGEPMVITSRGLQALLGMTELRLLQLTSSRIEDLSPIRNLKALSQLHLPNSSITDEGLAPIAGLGNLQHLNLSRNPKIADAGMTHLSGLPKLGVLSLGGTSVGDAGLPAIGRITSLTSLGLDGNRVTDSGLASLAGLKNLEHLGLGGKSVTGIGFRSLAGLTGLKTLSMNDSGVTDEGLAGIAQLPGLEHLSMWRTGVTVDGLAHLAAMPKLRHLSVDGTSLSDADLPRLRLPPTCKVFGVWQTKLTPAGIATLRARYPGVEIRNR
jgi:internalin A